MKYALLIFVFALGCAEGELPLDYSDSGIPPAQDVGYVPPKNDLGADEPDMAPDLPDPGCREGQPGCECTDGVTEPCPGNSEGTCDPGTRTCVEGTWGTCTGVVSASTETCNNLDDDCDGEVDEGLLDATCGVGVCEVTVATCVNGQAQTCEPGEPQTEICNNLDDDCDGEVDEGCECQPSDTRACYSGTSVTREVGECQDGVQTCGTNGQWGACEGEVLPATEICDGLDNDCNPATEDGSADPAAGAACDGPDSDLCENGTTACVAGQIACDEDPDLNQIESCNGMDDNCDGIIDNANLNDNPVCSFADNLYLGSVSGDTGSDTLSDSWYDEEFVEFTVVEDSTSSVYLSATITLVSAPGTDFDLYVRCDGCSQSVVGSSISTSPTDVVRVRRNDSFASSDTFDVVVEIRHASSTACGDWELTIQGNTSVATATCF